ncbi:acyl-coenzyme A:6-aminopenicillanic acid acyl-transferase-domain-containing protein [Aspergillus karnatakaensis]|uniref:acyl-coenzyme A:6-aminopenicillanic acid acyl-transferase-domain-containing protein n=1 Tax=Aspergillus karnatakaensis TaxID=1810916 RepID=UPI003CCD091A
MAPPIPTIRLKGGTPYTRGQTHGHQATSQISKNIQTYTSFFAETASLTWSEAKCRSTEFIPIIEKIYPEILDEIRGIADGAGVEVKDILALNVRSEIALTNYDNSPPEATANVPEITDGCTSLAQLSTDRKNLILAQNWDWLEPLAEGMVILDVTLPKENGGEKRFYTLTEAGLVGKIGLNSSGLGICLNALRCGAFSAEKLPTHIMARYLLERAGEFNEAVSLLKEYGGACAMNMVLADTEGGFATVEVTPLGVSVLRPGPSDATTGFDEKKGSGPSFIAHTNHVVTPPANFSRGAIYDRPAANSFSRLNRVTELTRVDAEGSVGTSVESVYERLKDQKNYPYSICRGVPVDAKGMERMTTLASVVVEMDLVEKNARGWVTIGRPCEDNLQKVEWAF